MWVFHKAKMGSNNVLYPYPSYLLDVEMTFFYKMITMILIGDSFFF